jgi:hypothetical protein
MLLKLYKEEEYESFVLDRDGIEVGVAPKG